MQSVFACIDIDHPVVAWAAYRGVLVSAQTGHEYPNCPISVMMAGMLKSRNRTRLMNELEIEKVRQLRHSECVSRLTGMYFFEEQSSMESASDWGGHFHPDYHAELGLFSDSTYSRHDANWITLAPLDTSGLIKSVDWIDNYWAGEPYPNRNPVWELVVNGRAAVYGTALRERAYSKLKENFPLCVAILEVGRIAACIDSDLGQTSAWLIQASEKEYSLQYFLDMRDANNTDFLQRLKEYSGPKNYADISVGGDIFSTPDFRRFEENFTINEPFTKSFFVGVHRN